LVESISGNPSGVEFMDYVQAGQIIRLGPHDTTATKNRLFDDLVGAGEQRWRHVEYQSV
jgi:hypothetical protein